MKRRSCKQRRTDAAPLKLRTHQNILHKNDCMSILYHADQSCKRCLLMGRRVRSEFAQPYTLFFTLRYIVT